MTRRRSAPADSLDLLLDTICNTFGGILFIALLVVLLLQISGTPQIAASPEEQLRAADLTHQRHTLLELKSRLESTLEKQGATVGSLSEADTEATLRRYQSEAAQQSTLKASIEELQRKQQQRMQEEQERLAEMSELESQLNEVRSKLAAAEQSRSRSQDSRRKSLELPSVRAPGLRSQVAVVIQFHRAYFWHNHSPSGFREGLNTEDFLILSEDGDSVETSPNPMGGVLLDGSKSSSQELLERLSKFDRSRHYLFVIVRPDSYGDFEQFRAAATSLRLDYDLRPSDGNTLWSDRGGTDGRVQ